MSSLIEKVEELRKLAAKEAPGTYETKFPEMAYETDALNALPAMLATLALVQPGDEATIEKIVNDYVTMRNFGIIDSIPTEILDYCCRMQKLAALMESTPCPKCGKNNESVIGK